MAWPVPGHSRGDGGDHAPDPDRSRRRLHRLWRPRPAGRQAGRQAALAGLHAVGQLPCRLGLFRGQQLPLPCGQVDAHRMLLPRRQCAPARRSVFARRDQGRRPVPGLDLQGIVLGAGIGVCHGPQRQGHAAPVGPHHFDPGRRRRGAPACRQIQVVHSGLRAAGLAGRRCQQARSGGWPGLSKPGPQISPAGGAPPATPGRPVPTARLPARAPPPRR